MAEKKRNFKAMADDELRKELDGLSKSLHGLRAQAVTSTVENKSQFRVHRRDIARILTEIRARELNLPPSAQAPGGRPAVVKPPADAPVRGPKPAVAVPAPAKAAEDKPSSAKASEGKPAPRKAKSAGKRSPSAKS